MESNGWDAEEDEWGEGVAVENCGGALSASAFMSMVSVSALGGVRGRPA